MLSMQSYIILHVIGENAALISGVAILLLLLNISQLPLSNTSYVRLLIYSVLSIYALYIYLIFLFIYCRTLLNSFFI